VHCRIYDPEKPQELADLIRYYIAHEDERESIAVRAARKYGQTTRSGSASVKYWTLSTITTGASHHR
jgi:hypothetical protein